jgi:hypothetical protein
MITKTLPATDYLHKRLRYDHDTGEIFWRDCSLMSNGWRTRWAGKPAFTNKEAKGYLVGKIDGDTFKAHRIAWAIYHGEEPKEQIDHVNGIRTDNRICNLRVVSNQENCRNKSMNAKNTSGVCGVVWSKKTQKWVAQIGISGRYFNLGYFHTLEEAAEARAMAAAQNGYSERHGVTVERS